MLDFYILFSCFLILHVTAVPFNVSKSTTETTQEPTHTGPTVGSFTATLQFFQQYSSSFRQCKNEYQTWSADQRSSYEDRSRSLYAASTEVSRFMPQFFTQSPECCQELYNTWQTSGGPGEQASSEYEASSSKLGPAYISEVVTTFETYNDAYSSCMKSLIPISTWIAEDGQLHGKSVTHSGTCEKSMTMITTKVPTTTKTMWDANSIIPYYSREDPCPRKQDCNQCVIYNDGVQILYWPDSVTWSGGRSFTVPPKNTGGGVQTADYHGTILTSPTVYLHYKSIWAGSPYDEADIWYFLGSMSRSLIAVRPAECTSMPRFNGYKNKIVPVPLDFTLSSMYYNFTVSRYVDVTATVESLNFADLAPNLLPMKQWQRVCPYGGDSHEERVEYCKTVVDEDYKPRLFQPEFLRSIDPAWKSCVFPPSQDDYDTIDPPFVLSSKPDLSVSTTDSKPTPDPPTPGQPANDPKITATRTAFNPDPPVKTTTSKPGPPAEANIPSTQKPEGNKGDPAGSQTGNGSSGTIGETNGSGTGNKPDDSDPGSQKPNAGTNNPTVNNPNINDPNGKTSPSNIGDNIIQIWRNGVGYPANSSRDPNNPGAVGTDVSITGVSNAGIPAPTPGIGAGGTGNYWGTIVPSNGTGDASTPIIPSNDGTRSIRMELKGFCLGMMGLLVFWHII